MPKSKKDPVFTRPPLTESRVKELVDDLLRVGFSDQARELEKHLTDIHKRILELEKNRR